MAGPIAIGRAGQHLLTPYGRGDVGIIDVFNSECLRPKVAAEVKGGEVNRPARGSVDIRTHAVGVESDPFPPSYRIID